MNIRRLTFTPFDLANPDAFPAEILVADGDDLVAVVVSFFTVTVLASTETEEAVTVAETVVVAVGE